MPGDTATEVMKRFMNNRVWRKTYSHLANNWMSIREASMEVDNVEESRGYTLNESVRRCINRLKRTKYLETEEKKKVKKSTTKKGDSRKYTTEATRHRLKTVALWTDYFAEKCLLRGQEKNKLRDILKKPPIEGVLKSGNLTPKMILKLLHSQFKFLKSAKTPELRRLFEHFDEYAQNWEKLDYIFQYVLDIDDSEAELILSKFFETVKKDQEMYSNLTKCIEKHPKEFYKEIMGYYEKFIKDWAERQAERTSPPDSLKPRHRKEFVNALEEEVDGYKEVPIQPLRKIGSKRIVDLLPN